MQGHGNPLRTMRRVSRDGGPYGSAATFPAVISLSSASEKWLPVNLAALLSAVSANSVGA